MKKLLAIVALMAMTLSLVACDGTQDDPTPTEGTTTSALEDIVTTTQADTPTTTNSSVQNPTGSQSSDKSDGTTAGSGTTQSSTVTTKYKKQYYTRYNRYIEERDGLNNTGYKIAHDKELTVAFMGGSITNGMGSSKIKGGYRTRVMNHLNTTYTDVKFTEIDASVGGNGSLLGTYIIDQYVLSKKPDLIFVEYAINNAHDYNVQVTQDEEEMIWNQYETIIHKARAANPYVDIVFLYSSNPLDEARYVIPLTEEIAKKYNVMSVNMFNAIKGNMGKEGKTIKEYFSDDSHLNDAGYDIYAEAVISAFEYALDPVPTALKKMTTPAAKTAIQNDAKVQLLSVISPTVPTGWTKLSNFGSNKFFGGGSFQSTQDGATMTVKFKGTHFGVLAEFASDAAIISYSVDGGAFQDLKCYLSFSNPKARMLCENVENQEHVVTLKLKHDTAYNRSRIALAGFLLNGTVLAVQ